MTMTRPPPLQWHASFWLYDILLLLISRLGTVAPGGQSIWTHSAHNFTLSGEVVGERSGVSALRCVLACVATFGCMGANYLPATAQCQLVGPAEMKLQQKDDSTAMFGIPYDELVDGQVGMWPLNEVHGGRNLIAGHSDLDLHNIIFDDLASYGISRPVRFSKHPSSYGKMREVNDFALGNTFAFVATVYRDLNLRHCPLLEFSGPFNNQLTNIWVKDAKLQVEIALDNCPVIVASHNVTVLKERFITVAVSFNGSAGSLSMWTDGERLDVATMACEYDLLPPADVYVNLRPTDPHQLNGYITCMSLYDRPMEYADMLSSTTPFC